jgi:hypothetical protein
MGGLKLQDLNWGMLNEIVDSNQSQVTGDRRRTSTSTMLQQAATLAYSPDAIGTRSEYQGFIVSFREVEYATYENPGSMLQEYVLLTNSTQPADATGDQQAEAGRHNNIAYKVYIPELNPQPAPRGANDPVLRSYPDIYSSMASMEKLPLGALVVVKYESPTLLRRPSIVRVVERDIIIENVSDMRGQELADAFMAGHPTTIGDGDGGWGEKPHQQRMMAEAKRLKEIRQEIFEDTTDKWNTARGDLPGPFSKKSSSWTRNAILSLADQKKLKSKFQSKIDEVARNLEMDDVKTLEKIFKKESGTFDPYAINHDTSATGLIQFMPEEAISEHPGTASSLGTTVEKLLTMGPAKQLEYVEQYFKKNKRASDNWEEVDWYFVVFYPDAIGQPDDYVIGNATTAAVNPGYADPNHPQNLITRRSVKDTW